MQAMMDGIRLPAQNEFVGGCCSVPCGAVEMHRVRCEPRDVHASLEARVDQQAATIRQSEKDLRALVDNAPTAMAYWDRDGRCRFGNLHGANGFRFRVQPKACPCLDVLGTGSLFVGSRSRGESLARRRADLRAAIREFGRRAVAGGACGSCVPISGMTEPAWALPYRCQTSPFAVRYKSAWKNCLSLQRRCHSTFHPSA